MCLHQERLQVNGDLKVTLLLQKIQLPHLMIIIIVNVGLVVLVKIMIVSSKEWTSILDPEGEDRQT